jgi:hypothetical protein
MKRTILAITAALLTMASTSFAATQAANASTISPTLQISATVQDAVQLTLSSGAGCAVNAGGNPPDYTMNFGTVDALAINAASCGGKFTPAQTSGDAVYYSDYVLKPRFTSQAATSGSNVTAYVSTAPSLANVTIVKDTANSAAAPAANGFSAMSTNAVAQSPVVSAASDGSSYTRYIGVDIAPTNGAGLTGAATATVTFTLTVQ